MIDVALVVGHNRERRGAYSPAVAEHEWEWNQRFAHEIVGRLHGFVPMIRAAVFERVDVGNYTVEMSTLVSAVNASNARLVVSLHFNALDGAHTGAAALHYPGSARGKAAATALATACSRCLSSRDIGAHAQARSWSAVGYDAAGKAYPAGSELYVLTQTKSAAVILEPFFGDHAGDATAATQARNDGRLPDAIARALRNLIVRGTI